MIEDRKEYIISRQIIRSGTAIGALVSEARYAESISDFIHKMSIALKECSETQYWLSLLSASNMIIKEGENELIDLCSEISYILIATINTAKKKMRK